MNKLIIVFVGFFCLLAWAMPVFSAQEDVQNDAGAKIQYQRHTRIDFSDVLIKGDIKRPAGFLILKRAHVKFQGLIKLRKDFDKKLMKSLYIVGE